MAKDYLMRESVESWTEWLEEFEREMIPLFSRFGYDRNAAMLAFTMQGIVNNTSPNEDDNWKDG